MKSLVAINKILDDHQESIGQAWLDEVVTKWRYQYPDLLSEKELTEQSLKLLGELAKVFRFYANKEMPDVQVSDELSNIIRDMSVTRAKVGFKVADTAFYMLSLKNILTKSLIKNEGLESPDLAASIIAIDALMDRLTILIFDSFISIREEIISQQSLSIQELSTPVIRLWDQILLLPLVGVIDTFRARQFTENLLVAISRYEATVTVIDVTGVPVFDTSVARHIMKTVDAAQLLGSRIIMTGISPEGALTLTKLGLNFSATLCRSTLRSGVAEAMQMIGKRIVNSELPK